MSISRIFALPVAAAMLGMICGCVEIVPVAEVLQQPVGSTISTRYNLWYVDADNISSKNIQQGRFLPVGSPVEVIKCNEDKLILRDAAGKKYTILLDDSVMMSTMRGFVAQLLTVMPPDKMFAAANSDKLLPFVKRGEVVQGMSREEVLLTYGPPPASRTPDLKNETWIYWATPSQTVRVIFRNEKVRNILNSAE